VVRVTQVLVNPAQQNTISDRTLQPTGIGDVRSLSSDHVNSSNEPSIWEGSKYLKTLRLDGCQGITDIGLSALGHGCRQLQSIKLSHCHGITDIGTSTGPWMSSASIN
jgi:Leucine Rich repeat